MHFYSFNLLGSDILLDISCTVFKIDILILDTMMEGTVSQNCYLGLVGPRFYFMK